MRRRTAVVGAAALAVVVLLGAVVVVRSGEPDLPEEEARAFLSAWSRGDARRIDQLAVPSGGAAADQHRFQEELRISRSALKLAELRRSQNGVTATFTAAHEVRGLGEWRTRSSLRLVRADDRWLVDWAPSALHPEARPEDRFERERTRPERAPILGAGGEPLTILGTVVAVGVQPSRIEDQGALAAALKEKLDIDPGHFDMALKAPGVKPDHFVPIVDLREERYQQVQAELRPLPGVMFRRKPGAVRLTLHEGLAAHTIGRTDKITAEQLETFGPTYEQGDIVGRSGLELARERDLAGTPSGEIRLVRPSGERRVLQRITGSTPKPVATTLRPDVQRAADAVLEGLTVPAALVAVDAATGAILAVSSRPLDEPLNRALSGRYPPGSTFKIVTAEALIAAGGPDQPLACPADVNVGGKRFKNFEGEALGDTTLRDAFVHSCNTAFAAAAGRLGNDALVAAAQRFGFGVDYDAGLGRRNPTAFPVPADEADRAAAGIGQGRVLATPAHMASVAAAATTGTWHAPHLVQPASPAGGGPTASPTAGAVEPLKAFMRAVVTAGTGRAAARVADLAGKTGTAEFGSGDPLPTHAWFVGERNGVGFALLLEGGGVGGREAGPLAARFAGAL